MSRDALKHKAELLHDMHRGDDILVLPCAWDAASAKVFAAEGAKAIGTTSLGVAASLGYTDGEKIQLEEYLQIIRRITRVVGIPVSVDIEAGFSRTAKGAAANVKLLLEAGAVGINVEDLDHSGGGKPALVPIPSMIEKIRAIRVMSEGYGVPVFINARTDAVWLSPGNDAEAAFQGAVERGKAYGAAGADCIFVPGDLDLAAITRLVQAIPSPVNIVIKSKTPSVGELREAGVKRVSLGSGPMRAGMGLTRKIAREALGSGTYLTMLDAAIPLDEVQSMFR
jgi:2-methylisocitrate lyase-like PEP mutase family enzyme